MTAPDTLTRLSLIILTLLSLTACVVAFMRLRRRSTNPPARTMEQTLVGVITLGSAAVFIYRAVQAGSGWHPLNAHIDGLLVIATLVAMTLLYLQLRSRLPGLDVFGLPVLTLVLAWAICAVTWTFQPFRIDSMWKNMHLIAVYLGSLFIFIAAIAGAMFLHVQRRLRSKQDLEGMKRLASLESLETFIIHTATCGFAFMTLGLVMGLVLVTTNEATSLGPQWWRSPKVILATVVWLIYAVVMNVRYAAHFRGSRAAWLSIVGLALLIATFGIVTSLPAHPSHQTQTSPQVNTRMTEVP